MQQGNAVAAGPGFFLSSVPRPTSKERRRSDLPGSWRTPLYARPALRPRQDGIRLAILAPHPAWPSWSNKLPAPTGFSISGLHHTAYALAVYASQRGSPLHHARLATGWWLTSTRWDSIPTGFHRKVSLTYIRSPSPKLCLAHIQVQLRSRIDCSNSLNSSACRGPLHSRARIESQGHRDVPRLAWVKAERGSLLRPEGRSASNQHN